MTFNSGDGEQDGKPLETAEVERKRERRQLLVSFAILLIIGVSLYFLVPYVKKIASERFIIAPLALVNLLLIPIFWILFGWTLMQGSQALGLVRRARAKAGRPIHIAILALLLIYALILLPELIVMTKATIMEIQRMRDPSLFPGGISVTSPAIALRLAGISERIKNFVYNRSAVFSAVGIILWLSKADKRKKRSKT